MLQLHELLDVNDRVGDLLGRELVQQLQVVLRLLPLELRDGHLPVVDRQEVDQLLVVLDVPIGLFNLVLQILNVAFFA